MLILMGNFWLFLMIMVIDFLGLVKVLDVGFRVVVLELVMISLV